MHESNLPRQPAPESSQSFDDLGLTPELRVAVAELGWQRPTPIQALVIPPALAGRDLIGLAATGSGKTAAFGLPIVQRLPADGRVRALVLSPTREITLQTKSFLDYFGASRRLRAVALIGGLQIRHQMDALARKPQIVVATPGRLLDHLERGTVRLDAVSELVLDEGDHMLDLGFMPQIHRILEHLPEQRHTMLFSATMPPPIERLAQRFLTEPLRLDVTPKGKAARGITHRLYLVDIDNKRPCILSLLNRELGTTLVFTRRKVDAEWLSRVLEREGHRVERIHSDLTQAQRLAALDGFREGRHRILVATDVAARGLDIPAIEHVINYDIPDTVEDYVHRAGRTARGDAEGVVSTIATFLDKPLIKEIEATLGHELPRCTTLGVEPYVEYKPRRRLGRRLR
ncbi:MAG: DEAD/DEAH box helicase [Acidobacteria bacterium]|nr:DEAD/DEAH box helicase [Thermoanaerobaculia bacterium]NLN10972.1 DEAD/DEAH box helicase [Acidobacteriota bacterium]MBP7813929.1 DEAD/DEAH box helicase [Thermoanaerobaculia bacterium]MBP8845208.1 DEAD/DEAH box helicase [Thermoanaerobaculia bacterium]HRR14716.1 DEAD/DEAH box helicase [Thermoanaerobaculia bacterium]